MARSHLVAFVADSAGNVDPSASVYVYEPNTTTQIPEAIYTTEAGGSSHVQPLTADAYGVLDIWVDGHRGPVTISTTANGAIANQNAEFITDPSAPHYVSVKSFRAKGDGQVVLNAVASSGVPELRLTDTRMGQFSALDVGKKFTIDGAGAAGAPLQGTITSVITSTRVGISVTPSTNVTANLDALPDPILVFAAWATDDTAAFQAAVAYLGEAGGVIGAPPGIYGLTGSVLTPTPRISFEGAGCAPAGSNDYGPGVTTLLAFGDGFTNDVVLGISVDTDGATALDIASFMQGPHVENLSIFNANDVGQNFPAQFNLTGIANGATGARFQHLTFTNLTRGWRSDTNPTGVDRPYVAFVSCARARNGGAAGAADGIYQISHTRGGDNPRIHHIQGNPLNGVAPNLVAMTSVRGGGEVSNILFGHTYLNDCNTVNVEQIHGEGEAILRIRDPAGPITVSNCYLQRQTTITPAIILERASVPGFAPGARVTLAGVQVHHLGIVAIGPDLQIDPSYLVVPENCERRWSRDNGTNFSDYPQFGLSAVGADGTTPVAGWNAQSGRLSALGWWDGTRAHVDVATEFLSGSPLSGLSNAAGPNWVLASGTYGYQVSVMYDVTRNIGVPGNFATVALTLGGIGAFLTLAPAICKPGLTLRVWRYAPSGTYPSFYVDIPMSGNVQYLFDQGNVISGYAWTQINATTITMRPEQIGNNPPMTNLRPGGQFLGSSAPTGGSWQAGDVVNYYQPSSGNPPRWNCSAAGKAHVGSTCTTSSSSNQNILTSVTNITTWCVGDAITGSGIPANTVVTNVDIAGTALGISHNATATATLVAIKGDAVFLPEANL